MATKVKCISTHTTFGNCDDAAKHLKIGETYTLWSKVIHSWHTKYQLAELRGLWFNSVQFEEVKENQ